MSLEAGRYPTIPEMLAARAAADPDISAIESVTGDRLTNRALHEQVQRTRASFRALGIGPRDRVAFVLPDGPEAAVAFLSIAGCAVAAPLNPAFRARKFLFYLQDLPARAVVVPAGMRGGVVDVARAMDLLILELVPRAGEPLAFDVHSSRPAQAVEDATGPSADSLALLLYTSGTTAQPKLVPLTHEKLAAAAGFTARALQLGRGDRGLHIVPTFHVQGLVTALLAPLTAHGTVVCAPGFRPDECLGWITDLGVTWYTGVPAMHEGIVSHARLITDGRVATALRFVRSSAAVLKPRLVADLEQVFGVPIVDGYGMTEAAPIIASTPLPPGVRKPGSVGRAAGPEIAIIDADGQHLVGPGMVGEIAIRGANVMTGYERDVRANEAAFVNGWFRTGDQGFLDEDGYLFLTGRIREIINRGGEKISPLEVEACLLEHPAIAEAVVFGVPDPRLGETVAAAVVLRRGAPATERDLRDYAGSHLAFFKVPGRIVVVDELPKGPTGKLQRVGLAGRLGLTDNRPIEGTAPADPPRTALERELVKLWCATLETERVGIHDNFFVLGGNSIVVAEMLVGVEQATGVRIAPERFFPRPSIAELAEDIGAARASAAAREDRERDRSDASLPVIVPLQPAGSRTPIFLVHSGGAGAVCLYTDLAQALGSTRPVFGIQADSDPRGPLPPYHPATSIEEVAARYVRAMRAVRPHGPYHLGGASFGGMVAYEMARQLTAQGERVGLLVMFATHVRNNASVRWSSGPGAARLLLQSAMGRVLSWSPLHRTAYGLAELRYRWLLRRGVRLSAENVSRRFFRESRRLTRRYWTGEYDGRVLLFRASQDRDTQMMWDGVTAQPLEVQEVAGGHLDMLSHPRLPWVVELLRKRLHEAECAVLVPGSSEVAVVG